MNLRIVLVRPAEPMNVGAVARAMKNCAAADLVLVAPRTEDWVTARRVAVHAEELLASPKVVSSLGEAVADCVWVVGTTSRLLAGRSSLTPSEVGQRAASELGRVALVFGGEESGLSNEDLLQCHDLSTIPSGAEQPSFNLGQAVLVYAYEAFVARGLSSAAPAPGAAPPTEREVALIEDALRAALQASAFADLDRPRHGVLDLLQPLRRGRLTSAEARLWHAALRTIHKALRRTP